METYLGCCLESLLDGKPERTRPLHLVIAMDVSGSMMSPLGTPTTEAELLSMPLKSKAVQDAVRAVAQTLLPDDHLGVVTFKETSEVLLPLAPVAETDVDAAMAAVADVRVGGGTDLMAGLQPALDMLRRDKDAPADVERRVLFLTDMEDRSEDADGVVKLQRAVQDAAAERVHCTFVGVGTSFVAETAASAAAAPGANVYTITKMPDVAAFVSELAYILFPIAFDVRVDVDGGEEWDVVAVYGKAGAELEEKPEGGAVFSTGCLFPSHFATGGMLLCKLQPHVEGGPDDPPSATVTVNVSYTTVRGSGRNTTTVVELPRHAGAGAAPMASGIPIRKALLLHFFVEGVTAVLRSVEGRDGADSLKDAGARLKAATPALLEEAAALADRSISADVASLAALNAKVDARLAGVGGGSGAAE